MSAVQAAAIGAGAGTRTPSRLYLVACLVSALAALPLLVTAPVPLHDWPNHLARVHILDEMLRGVGPWTRFYELNSFLLPNIALDLGILGMLRLGLSVDLAGAVFMLLTFALFVTGFVRLSASVGANDAVKPLLGATLFYNTPLFWGLVNFTVGLGLLLWVVALWIGATRAGTRLAIAVLGSAAAFACHIIPAMLIVGILGLLDLYALWRAGWPRDRTALRHCMSLAALVTVAVLLKASPTGGDQLSLLGYNGSDSVLNFVIWKGMLLPKSFLRGGIWADAAFAVFGLALAASVLWAARIRIGIPMLLVLGVIAVLSIVAPARIGQGDLFDLRIAIVPLVMAAAVVQFRWRRASGPALVVAVVAALVLVRSTALAVAWHDAGRTYAKVDAALARLPPGGILITAWGRSFNSLGFAEFWTPPMSHVSVFASQHGQFVPSVFAYPTQQPVVLRPQFRDLIQPFGLDTPEKLALGLEKARSMCPGGDAETTFPSVWLAVFYPDPSMRPPRFQPVVPQYSLLDACAPS